jgi:hypothetical protein
MAERHSASGTTIDAERKTTTDSYMEVLTVQSVTQYNQTSKQWVLASGNSTSTEHTEKENTVNKNVDYTKKMDTNFDTYSGYKEEHTSDFSVYDETLYSGITSGNLSQGILPKWEAMSGTATLTEDGSYSEIDLIFDKQYRRALSGTQDTSNPSSLAYVTGFVGDSTIASGTYHFVSNFSYKAPQNSNSKQWVHTSGTGNQIVDYANAESYVGSGTYILASSYGNGTDYISYNITGTIHESGSVNGVGEQLRYDYTFTEGDSDWTETKTSGTHSEISSFAFTDTRTGSYSSNKIFREH